jgi:hypothetical protein
VTIHHGERNEERGVSHLHVREHGKTQREQKEARRAGEEAIARQRLRHGLDRIDEVRIDEADDTEAADRHGIQNASRQPIVDVHGGGRSLSGWIERTYCSGVLPMSARKSRMKCD